MDQKEQIHPWSMILLRSYTVKCRLLLNFLSVPSILPVHSTLWFLPAFWHEQTASRSEILNTNLYIFLPSQSNSFPVTLTCCGAQKHITWVIVPLNFSGRMNLRITVRPASEITGGLKGCCSMCPLWNLVEKIGQRAKALSEHLSLSYPCLPDWLFDSPSVLP